MSNNLARAIRRNVCAPVEKFGGSLEAINDDYGPTQSIQIHKIFCHPGKPDLSQE